MKTLQTPQGPVQFVDPTKAQLDALRAQLPMGLMSFDTSYRGANHGIVMKCGDREALAVKQQPVEVAPEDADTCFMANSVLIAISLRDLRLVWISDLVRLSKRWASISGPRTAHLLLKAPIIGR